MKIQIRRNVFETNSSNEHSLTVMNNEKFKLWKEGKILARVKTHSESDNTWGNFWSYLYTLEFSKDLESAKKDNEIQVEIIKKRSIDNLESYKQRCLNYKKKITTPLSDEDLKKLSVEERAEYNDKLYEDKMYEFDEDYYNEEMKLYKELTLDTFSRHHFSKMDDHIWMTYEEFWEDFITDNDCYSPFEHEDLENNIHIIGKYYHS